jgi:hypothetical protein
MTRSKKVLVVTDESVSRLQNALDAYYLSGWRLVGPVQTAGVCEPGEGVTWTYTATMEKEVA